MPPIWFETRRIAMTLLLVALAAPPCSADQFDAIDGPVLSRLVASKEVKPVLSLSMKELSSLPSLLKETRSALLVVKTGQGNYTRVLAVPELRKPASGQGEPFPIVVLERFDTFDAANKASRIGKGRDLILFQGFRADLDSGHVVPEGEGGDLRFVFEKGQDPRIEAVGGAQIFIPTTLPVPQGNQAPMPTPGRRVVPADFSGRYQLFSNGQLSGVLDLAADPQGAVRGSFRSDLQGSAYEVTGQVASESPQRLRFTIKFPRSTQEFDGYLWADGKGAMAGTVSVLERTFGFFAIREGGRIAADGVELTDATNELLKKEAVVEVGKTTLRFRGRSITLDDLAAQLKESGILQVRIVAESSTPFERVETVIKQLRAAGVQQVHLESAADSQK